MHKDKKIMNWQPFMNEVYSVYHLLYNIILRHWNNRSLFIELHHRARALLWLLNTSAAYTHGQIVDAELTN